MRITIVMGFFLPMPPQLGGATEKTWHRLAGEFAARGHAVTIVSRRWREWPHDEIVDGVRYLRIPGFDHTRSLLRNLMLDLLWSWRVQRALPAADVVVVNAVTLPIWLGRLRPAAGRVVVMPGRMPKGQYHHYHRIARVLATSTPVLHRVAAENPRLADITRVVGYPIDYELLAQPRPPGGDRLTVGYAGRIHPEKGVGLLVAAAAQLQGDLNLPRWRLAIRGPHAVAAGGGGDAYRAGLEAMLWAAAPGEKWSIEPATFDARQLAEFYRSVDIFVYPSLAADGETFGVAVAEAMAAGAVPLVSDLACFRDFVRPGVNGLVFDHHRPDASTRLAESLAALLRDANRRRTLAAAAQADVRGYHLPQYAGRLLDDFSALVGCSA